MKNKHKKALNMALEALEPMENSRDDTAIQRAITTLPEALAEQTALYATTIGEGHMAENGFEGKRAKKPAQHQGGRMNIVLYSKSNCPNCVSAKQLLKSKGLEYFEIDCDNPYEFDGLRERAPGVKQLPQIFIDGQRVGGLAGLQAALKQVEL